MLSIELEELSVAVLPLAAYGLVHLISSVCAFFHYGKRYYKTEKERKLREQKEKTN